MSWWWPTPTCSRPLTRTRWRRQARGTYFEDGQILESARVMGSGGHACPRRVVYRCLFTRHQRGQQAINAQNTRAEKVSDGTRPLKKDRFVRLDGTDKGVDWDLVQRAGGLDRVIQINVPGIVASFPQRIGRTGRRSGATRNCLFLADHGLSGPAEEFADRSRTFAFCFDARSTQVFNGSQLAREARFAR